MDIKPEPECSCLMHDSDLINKDCQNINGHELTQNKLIALYFSSNWCEPCHTFNKTLIQVSESLSPKLAADFIIINVLIETSKADADSWCERIPTVWFTLPFDSSKIKSLANKYCIRTVPRLVICKANGNVITTKGRSEIEIKHSIAVVNWFETANAKPKQLLHGFDIIDDNENSVEKQVK